MRLGRYCILVTQKSGGREEVNFARWLTFLFESAVSFYGPALIK
jgi:hypothetical protein